MNRPTKEQSDTWTRPVLNTYSVRPSPLIDDILKALRDARDAHSSTLAFCRQNDTVLNRIWATSHLAIARREAEPKVTFSDVEKWLAFREPAQGVCVRETSNVKEWKRMFACQLVTLLGLRIQDVSSLKQR